MSTATLWTMVAIPVFHWEHAPDHRTASGGFGALRPSRYCPNGNAGDYKQADNDRRQRGLFDDGKPRVHARVVSELGPTPLIWVKRFRASARSLAAVDTTSQRARLHCPAQTRRSSGTSLCPAHQASSKSFRSHICGRLAGSVGRWFAPRTLR